MAEQGYTSTNQLANVIDAIQLGRKSGMLTILRGEGAGREEGQILFVSGQVSRASLGTLQGADALRVLTSWQNCRFLFQPTLPASSSAPMQFSPAVNPTGQASKAGRTDERGIEISSPHLYRVPQRIWRANDALTQIERRGLTRSHRHLFLLIDGQRSVKDLVVLIGRPPAEILALLIQLEQAGLIRQ